MMKRCSPFLLVTLMMGMMFSFVSAQTTPQEIDAALQRSELGPYQPAEEDWDAIEAAAREEGEVVLYSLSSRHPAVIEIFEQQYGVTVIYAALNTEEQLQRLDAQQRAQRPEADVMFISEAPQVWEYLEQGRLIGYMPRELEAVIPVGMRTPSIKHGTEALTALYNQDTHADGPPISSWWDLTRPEWRGRIQAGDLSGSIYQMFFATFIQHADEMEAEYERVFGEPISYTQPHENAGYEFMKRILENQPRRIQSPAEMMDTLGTEGYNGVTLLGTAQIRRAEHLLRTDDMGGLDIPVSTEIQPRWAMLFSHTLVIPASAPNPNAAKLLYRFLLDVEGYAPWASPGTFPPRTDWEAPPYTPALDLDNVWIGDPTYHDEIQGELLDFFRMYE